MLRWFHDRVVDVTGVAILCLVGYLVFMTKPLTPVALEDNWGVPSSFLTVSTIFLSIIIESIPFVVIGVLIAGLIQVFVTEDHIRRWMPRNRILAVVMSCVIGALFPACECGIVPIVRRLVTKGVPLHAGIGFLLTGPLINPVVIFSTYMAFGNDAEIAGLRMGLGFVVAVIVALFVSILFTRNQLKVLQPSIGRPSKETTGTAYRVRFGQVLRHSIDEFFDVGKYLMVGALLAACVQTYVSSSWLLGIGEGVVSSTLVMMGLAYLLSLCSEADAFIGASFRNIFPTSAILSFLVFGPMMDVKNTIMMLGVFRARFVFILLGFIGAAVFTSIMIIGSWL
ncbi:permease [Paenibacillus sp. TRM 82003]|nr:permease [Paenibacillus sp. TRM 82003]